MNLTARGMVAAEVDLPGEKQQNDDKLILGEKVFFSRGEEGGCHILEMP